jgi:hypothetical protein
MVNAKDGRLNVLVTFALLLHLSRFSATVSTKKMLTVKQHYDIGLCPAAFIAGAGVGARTRYPLSLTVIGDET